MARSRMPHRPGLLRRRRRMPVGTFDFDPTAWGAGRPPGEDDGGLAGVREPRRPKPTLPTMAAEAPLPTA